VETSAKEATNVEDAFLSLTYDVKQRIVREGPKDDSVQDLHKLSKGLAVKKSTCC
jgi:hypothetical protein